MNVIRPVSEDQSLSHYTLRYLLGTDLNKAKHQFTQVRIPFADPAKPSISEWIEAEDHRLALPSDVAARLEVVAR